MNLISIVTPCYNEEGNVEELHQQIKNVFNALPHYDYEHIFIDNSSSDATVEVIKQIITNDPHVRLIVNTRNFGHIRSPMYALTQTTGDAVVLMAADLQDPPGLLPSFIAKWEAGYRIVVGVKAKDNDHPLMSLVRRSYYSFMKRIGDAPLIRNFMGFGLYDKVIVNHLKQLNDPYPYFRGIISDIGFEYAEIPYEKPKRKRGITKNNFYDLYDMAMLGITSYSKVPLRLATMVGFALSVLSFMVAIFYFFAKLLFWDHFYVGFAPVVIGLFFFGSVQLFFIGVLGEYIASIHTQVMKRPLVVVKEKINF